MRIDWKALANDPDPLATFDAIPGPADIDWSDPTHVPCMVSAAVYEIGNLSECLSDEEHADLCVTALDAMPRGEAAVTAAVQDRCYELAAANGWSDCLIERHSGKYVWEP